MIDKTEIIYPVDGEITHRQGDIHVVVRIRHWLIRKIAGNMPVLLNLDVSPHTQGECDQVLHIAHCKNGLFFGCSIRAKGNHGITMQQIGKGRCHDQ